MNQCIAAKQMFLFMTQLHLFTVFFELLPKLEFFTPVVLYQMSLHY